MRQKSSKNFFNVHFIYQKGDIHKRKITSNDIQFHVSIRIELRKMLQVHFYIVEETEKIHHYQLCQHNTMYV